MRRDDDADHTECSETALMEPWLWLVLFVLLAYTVEAATGFGSIVIALSLGALVLPIDALLPVLVPLNLSMSGYLALRYRGHIHWPLLLRQVLPLMAVGTGLGHGLKPLLGRGALQGVFGVLIIGLRSGPCGSGARRRRLTAPCGCPRCCLEQGLPTACLPRGDRCWCWPWPAEPCPRPRCARR